MKSLARKSHSAKHPLEPNPNPCWKPTAAATAASLAAAPAAAGFSPSAPLLLRRTWARRHRAWRLSSSLLATAGRRWCVPLVTPPCHGLPVPPSPETCAGSALTCFCLQRHACAGSFLPILIPLPKTCKCLLHYTAQHNLNHA
ncbi:hypothetical protein U1Q18_047361 [Sarracenia purpurea var. burkii]